MKCIAYGRNVQNMCVIVVLLICFKVLFWNASKLQTNFASFLKGQIGVVCYTCLDCLMGLPIGISNHVM